jgi:putative transposase
LEVAREGYRPRNDSHGNPPFFAGEVWDNSGIESFFSSVKTERTSRKVCPTRVQARSDVFDYIERFYTPTRRHSTLGYVSPVQFEEARRA